MTNNEVVNAKKTEENSIKEKPETISGVAIDLNVREDLNDIVKTARYEEIKSKYGTRHPYFVTLFNNVKIEFSDPDNFYDLLISAKDAGLKDYVISKRLVEELKTNEDNEPERVYVCMKYELSDGSTVRLFPKSAFARRTLINYYNLFKAQQKAAIK